MHQQNQYFYIPDRRPFSVIGQYIPADNWSLNPRVTLYLSSSEATFEINFASEEGVKLLSETLEKFTEKYSQRPDTIHTQISTPNSVS